MKRLSKRLTFISLLIIFISSFIHCQVKLPRLVSDGMVLQRDSEVKIWGWASENEQVEISFLDSIYKTSADENGDWSVTLSGLNAGGPYTMKITASNTIEIKDILIGEVWVCSGQSQMDINMERVRPLYEKEIAEAGNPFIHYFSVPTVFDFNQPKSDLPAGNWEAVSQQNILRVSAIAYFFAVEMYNKYKVPIGMIRSSLGGSPVQAWISKDVIKAFPEYYNDAVKFQDASLIQKIRKEDSERMNAWYTKLNRTDAGYMNPDKPWYLPETDISDWSETVLPGYWDETGPGVMNGSVWYRKDFKIPADLAAKPARLNLGRIVDADSVFVNGTFVGSVGYQYPPRRYQIPANVLNAGENTIVVRVISNIGTGGFVPDKPYELVIEDKTFDLKGKWYYKPGAVMEPLQEQTFIRWKPTGLYNGMIAPLTNYSIKGVLWYQGESNTDKPMEYTGLLQAMIKNWRNSWKLGDFPFIYVQLPNYMKSYDFPTESNWALMRESQLHVLKTPHTSMVTAIDLGEWNDIHPLNKKDVAIRLALAARKTAYHETDLVASGPLYKSMKISGDSIVITFTETGGGLISKGGEALHHFAIAGKNKKFIWASARISGNKVIIWNDKIKKPVAVRYAWADNPEGANLCNKEGLPASPFRTDNW